jgi:hypothetical protein
MELKYFAKIPFDIIINHILPYTYNIQSKELLYDIKNYREDLNLVENCYLFDYNYVILYRDLGEFYEFKFNKLINIGQLNKKYWKKIRFIWGKLTPKLRTEFINTYILEDA